LAIRFAGLGFWGQAEANAWLSMHILSHDFGWILDPHIVMEHTHYAVTTEDTLKRLEGIYKLKLSTIAQGLAVSSFENKVPEFFSKASTYKVIKDDSSYFDAIPSFADCDEKDNGWRNKLEEEFVSLQSSMDNGISLQFGAGTPAYHVASVTRSVGWIRGLKDFMDEYYKELTRGKFGTKKAWHVTTRLAKWLLVEVAAPQVGVVKTLHAGDLAQIAQTIFWASLRSLDIMERIHGNHFKNDPLVSSELVKFLAINTGFEAIKSLKKTVTDHQDSIDKAVKQSSSQRQQKRPPALQPTRPTKESGPWRQQSNINVKIEAKK
jgi:hypothetical protein